LPITLGVAVHQFALGNEKSGIVLGLAALMIGAADNLIRPIFLKGAANLHPLLAFVAAFGGLQTLGFLGVFLGPIVASLFIVTLKVLSQKEGNDPL
jgi:predicted PurR-regulated permease PerM